MVEVGSAGAPISCEERASEHIDDEGWWRKEGGGENDDERDSGTEFQAQDVALSIWRLIQIISVFVFK